MIFKDYYKILNIDGPKHTMDEIKIAYRDQAKKYHPDVNVGNRTSEERFKDINEAYRVLSDAIAKKKYDKLWNTNIGKKRERVEESKRGKEAIFSDFFNMFFGEITQKVTTKKINNEKNAIKGENIETEVEISLEEAFYGLEKKISLRMINGKMKIFNIKIPAGIRNGEKIRLLGQGKTGENGGRNGDLFIKVNIQNSKRFKLSGYDIIVDLLLTPWEAALGTKLEVDTIDEKITIIVPQGTDSGNKLEIEGKGYKKDKGERGNLIAKVKILVPKELSEEEKELYHKLKEISSYKPRKNYG